MAERKGRPKVVDVVNEVSQRFNLNSPDTVRRVGEYALGHITLTNVLQGGGHGGREEVILRALSQVEKELSERGVPDRVLDAVVKGLYPEK